ncbi:cysteine--tRNA ligase [Halonatronum saccharophilum]|uniref:cysteine--tRNA ligase n=2 Tax=Halonatronum saccharophilum TaxID=150060 RepID=UPI0004ACCC61|nr:cysteine--tRNA ligase [Halonatronum saccharophilum]
MGIKIYNTLSGEKEDFKPIKENEVGIYSCGPTVYDYFHIGNARAFIVPDIIKRYLNYRGYKIFHVLNFTDIDDKMIKRANQEEVTIEQLANRFIKAYFEDTDALNIRRADIYPKATEHIEGMIDLVEKLIAKDYAYSSGGDVYFRVEKFDEYGKLSKQHLEDLEAGNRVEVSGVKENPLDFTLWKESKEGEPSWESPWGLGRPGWHIECSVMSTKYLGDRFDIHTGGVDLTFPHHENEVAQSEACCGHQVVNYWVHNGYINIDGEKMSKSLDNFFTIREILEKYKAEVIRFFLISKHYRSPINFSDSELDSAKKSLGRLLNTLDKVENLLDLDAVEGGGDKGLKGLAQETEVEFKEAMDDDFNTALAIAVLHTMVKEVNLIVNNKEFILTEGLKEGLKEIKSTFESLAGDVLGILPKQEEAKGGLIDPLIELLVEVRSEVRKNKNYELADKIRDELKNLGVQIKDTPQGVEWKLK